MAWLGSILFGRVWLAMLTNEIDGAKTKISTKKTRDMSDFLWATRLYSTISQKLVEKIEVQARKNPAKDATEELEIN